MRHVSTFYRGISEGSAAAGQGVAHGLLEAFPISDVTPLPDRLQELVSLLIERDALGRGDEEEVARAADPTRLVVVLEDDPTTRERAMALLEETVLDVVTCETGADAVALLQERGNEVAMVFADMQMPGAMDGIDLARAVQTIWPRIRLVVTSGGAENRIEELPSGIIHLRKPWRALDVLMQVDRAVRCPNLPVR
ncbi:response regulator [Methylobacterium platani]|uniref:response regulator n=1 Tax=Methylobacterium platani TaxID=427683 RepID=UPI0009F207B6|nr:response regulator [Methylobacterium platani]